MPLSDLQIRNNNGEGIAQQARLSLSLRRWKMAAPPTPPPQHPRVPGLFLFSYLTVIDIITIYKSIRNLIPEMPLSGSVLKK